MTQRYPALGRAAWLVLLGVALTFPLVVTVPYFQSTAVVALMFVALAVAFDIVVGRVGALSLAQPVFLGFGAYAAGILSVRFGTNFWVEAAIGAAGAVALAVLIGIPSFRLSLHSFAIGTLGFAIGLQLIAQNWIDVTRGPLCTTGIRPLALPFPWGTFSPAGYTDFYYVILAIATLAVALVWYLMRTRLGLAFTTVRDDPVLADARGLWPTELRITAFAMSAAITGVVGAFLAHFQGVVCPNTMGISYTVDLLIMVFIGGRGSLRGVVTAALLFTIAPQLLRLADEWRLVIYGGLLLVIVTTIPDGIEQLYRGAERLITRVLDGRAASAVERRARR